MESWNHRMLRVGRILKHHLAPILCHNQGCHPLGQVSQGPIKPGLQHFQGWGIHKLSRQPADCCSALHVRLPYGVQVVPGMAGGQHAALWLWIGSTTLLGKLCSLLASGRAGSKHRRWICGVTCWSVFYCGDEDQMSCKKSQHWLVVTLTRQVLTSSDF